MAEKAKALTVDEKADKAAAELRELLPIMKKLEGDDPMENALLKFMAATADFILAVDDAQKKGEGK